MGFFHELFAGQSVASAILILALVTALGLAIGSIRYKGLGLGIAGVLFAGIGFGHFGVHLNEEVLHFVREFGLVLFVYTIGMQVGPGFLASLRRAGLPLNVAAACIVIGGALLAVGFHKFLGVQLPAAVGLFSGATTNTPSLAAAQQALADIPMDDATRASITNLPGVGYAVAYPFGVIGIIMVMVLIRALFRVNMQQEEQTLAKVMHTEAPRLSRLNIEVSNPNLAGIALKDVPLLSSGGGASGGGLVVSRIFQDGQLSVPQPETALKLGDVLLAVGTQEELNQLRMVIGKESSMDLRTQPSTITTKRIVVTQKAPLGKTLAELDYVRRFGVALTRVSRSGVEMATMPGFALQYGDTVLAVGEKPAIDKVATELGDSPKTLNHPQVIPVFVGIALGILVGSIPFTLPGVPAPVKLGLAGGPLIVAIILSRVGNIGPLVWYLPISANFMLRELGIVLFLACVGLKSGQGFVDTLVHGPGLEWMGLAAIITVVPLLAVALVMRLIYKTNYLMICGLLAGSMTDPPALQFANSVAGSDSPALAYATVYPLTMILRVLCAQLMVILLMS
ncbi:MAG: putative transporter [Phycisphaeraceae bacterium]|nr:putative transporter [Phycisphaeraceae bacterium]